MFLVGGIKKEQLKKMLRGQEELDDMFLMAFWGEDGFRLSIPFFCFPLLLTLEES